MKKQSTYLKMVYTLANQLVGKGLDRSNAFSVAHYTVKNNPDCFLLSYYSKSAGKEVTRVVVLDWYNHDEPKGGAARPSHLLVYSDLCYIALRACQLIEDKKSVTRCTVKANITGDSRIAA